MQNDDIKVEIIEGVGKKSNKPYKAVKLTIGVWYQLVFPRSSFEMDYIQGILES